MNKSFNPFILLFVVMLFSVSLFNALKPKMQKTNLKLMQTTAKNVSESAQEGAEDTKAKARIVSCSKVKTKIY